MAKCCYNTSELFNSSRMQMEPDAITQYKGALIKLLTGAAMT